MSSGAPAASRMRKVASMISGPIPSPLATVMGIRVDINPSLSRLFSISRVEHSKSKAQRRQTRRTSVQIGVNKGFHGHTTRDHARVHNPVHLYTDGLPNVWRDVKVEQLRVQCTDHRGRLLYVWVFELSQKWSFLRRLRSLGRRRLGHTKTPHLYG